MTHTEAHELFGKCRNQERGYKLANNTRIQQRGHAFAIRLYETDIVMIRPDRTYRLNSGGHRTSTTKGRMNRVLPCSVLQMNGMWYVGDALYTDGMLIGPDGKAIGAKPRIEIEKTKRMVDKRTSQFIKLLSAACIGRDIGPHERYHGNTLPRPANKTHLKRLWELISSPVDQMHCNMDKCIKLIYLATMFGRHGSPLFVWESIRSRCYGKNESEHIKDNLRAFMRLRKPMIAEMIATGEIT